MVGILVSFRDGLFSGTMLVSGRVEELNCGIWYKVALHPYYLLAEGDAPHANKKRPIDQLIKILMVATLPSDINIEHRDINIDLHCFTCKYIGRRYVL